jgi:hypothetical protein
MKNAGFFEGDSQKTCIFTAFWVSPGCSIAQNYRKNAGFLASWEFEKQQKSSLGGGVAIHTFFPNRPNSFSWVLRCDFWSKKLSTSAPFFPSHSGRPHFLKPSD